MTPIVDRASDPPKAWTVPDLLDDLATRGRHPAVIVSSTDRVEVCDSATLAGAEGARPAIL